MQILWSGYSYQAGSFKHNSKNRKRKNHEIMKPKKWKKE